MDTRSWRRVFSSIQLSLTEDHGLWREQSLTEEWVEEGIERSMGTLQQRSHSLQPFNALAEEVNWMHHHHPNNSCVPFVVERGAESNLGGSTMATQIVMDHTGDTRHSFDLNDEQSLTNAEERFKKLTGLGFTAAVRTGPDQMLRLRSFDPTCEETLFFPRLVGG